MSLMLTRRSLDSSLHGSVDLVLKSLKMVARRISSSLAAFEDESRLLDRLFYKGKNQHRWSKFWRHVEEMRRFHSRLHRLNVFESVNRTRHAFYNNMDYENQKILKSSWTHVPQTRSLRTTIHGFRQTTKLLIQISEKYMLAYCSFKRAMQTGAFLQLILTLAAVSCRLHALTLLLLEDHHELISSLTNLCSSLETSSPKLESTENLAIDLSQGPLTVSLISSTVCSFEVPVPPKEENRWKLDSEILKKVEDKPEPKEQSEPHQEIRKSAMKAYKGTELPTDKKPKKKKNKKLNDEIDAIFGV